MKSTKNMQKNLISQGAEAILYLENNLLVKERIKKSYRISEIDDKLRKLRTRSEAKIIKKIENNVPKIIDADEKTAKITMEYIDGELIKNILDNLPKEKRIEICNQIGNIIKQLHEKNVIHGDLTTSNMILKDDKVYFIDFGLSFISPKVEDKAVDLHLLKQALESKHYTHFDESFKAVLKGYAPSKEFLTRLAKVEQRGRYKSKN